jgi:hypothetical protein
MKHLTLLSLAMALALPMVVAPRPAAAAETVNAVAQAVGEQDPFVFTWVDGADGQLRVNPEIAQQFHGLFANARYLVLDNGQLVIGQLQGQELKTIAPTLAVAKSEDNMFFIAHYRSQDQKFALDGTIDRYRNDPSRGYAQFNLTVVTQDGSTATTLIQQNLTFPGSSPAPTPRG